MIPTAVLPTASTPAVRLAGWPNDGDLAVSNQSAAATGIQLAVGIAITTSDSLLAEVTVGTLGRASRRRAPNL